MKEKKKWEGGGRMWKIQIHAALIFIFPALWDFGKYPRCHTYTSRFDVKLLNEKMQVCCQISEFLVRNDIFVFDKFGKELKPFRWYGVLPPWMCGSFLLSQCFVSELLLCVFHPTVMDVWMEAPAPPPMMSDCSHPRRQWLSDTCGLYLPSTWLFYSTSVRLPVIISNLSTHVSHNEVNEVIFNQLLCWSNLISTSEDTKQD